MGHSISRREFFKKSANIGLSTAAGIPILSRLLDGPARAYGGELPSISVVKSEDTFQSTRKAVADLNTIIAPTLCVVDATELITTNGPLGPGELITPRKVIAGVDRVAIDAYCATLWGLKAVEIFHIQASHAHGLGQMDLSKVKIQEVEI